MPMLRATSRRQEGYILLSVMLLVTLMLIALSVELPRIAQQIKREKEEELVHRGMEYAKAVKKYRRKMGALPTSIEQLEDTNHIRFLRKRYKDPFTGEDFKLVHAGEAVIPMPKNNNSTLQITDPGIGDSSSSFNSGAPSPRTGNGSGSNLGSSPNVNTGVSAFQTGNGLGSLQTDNSGTQGALQVGGGGIIGVASTSKKSGIKEFNDNSEYDQWYFVYDPRLEQATGQNASATAGIIVAAPQAGAGGGGSSNEQNPPQPTGTPAPPQQ